MGREPRPARTLPWCPRATQSTTLRAGDSVLVPEGEVHASFNDADETAFLQVVIAPSLGGETGYGLEDVADQEPWSTLRARSSR